MWGTNNLIICMNYESVGTLVAVGGCNVCVHMACICEETHNIWKNNRICPTWWQPPVSVHVYAICHWMWHYVHVTHKCVIHDEWDKSGNIITYVSLTTHVSQWYQSDSHILLVFQLEELWKVYCVLQEFRNVISLDGHVFPYFRRPTRN